MPFMVSTTWPTTSPPLTATPEALSASWLACLALSAFCLTVDDNSSMEAAVSSSAEACSSVRWLRSWLPWAICAEAVATPSALPRTPPTMAARLSFMPDKACRSCAVSSLPSHFNSTVRSPAAMRSAASTARATGRVIEPGQHPAERQQQQGDDDGADHQQPHETGHAGLRALHPASWRSASFGTTRPSRSRSMSISFIERFVRRRPNALRDSASLEAILGLRSAGRSWRPRSARDSANSFVHGWRNTRAQLPLDLVEELDARRRNVDHRLVLDESPSRRAGSRS